MRRVLVLLSLLVLPFPAHAQQAAPDFGACNSTIPITRARLRQIEDFRTAQLSGRDAVIVAQFKDGEGTGIFLRRGASWRGYTIAATAGIQGIFQASLTHNIFIWVYEGLGDPPYAFTGMFISGPDPTHRFCTRIKVPEVLNRGDNGKPEWNGEAFSFDYFNVASGGRGAIVGTADIKRHGFVSHLAFRYSSSNGGRRWGAPSSFSTARPVPGMYTPIDERSKVLMDSLRLHAH